MLSTFSVLCGKNFTAVWFGLMIIPGENFHLIQMTVIVLTVEWLKFARCKLTDSFQLECPLWEKLYRSLVSIYTPGGMQLRWDKDKKELKKTSI